MIRDHVAANLGVEPDDFEYAPFAQEGGLGKVHQVFGNELNKIIEELNLNIPRSLLRGSALFPRSIRNHVL